MIPKMWRGVVFLVMVGFACAALAQTASVASVPPLIKVSGTISGDSGSTVGVTFALYAEQTGGAPLWLETQNVAVDANGRYTIFLGANHANGVPLSLFATGEAQWLGVQPEGQAEQARVQLVSVPYAMTAGDAQTLGGQPLSAFVMASSANGSATTTGSTATAAASGGGIVALATPQGTGTNVTTSGAGLANYLAKFTSATNVENSSMVYDTGTAVGIGTTTPAAMLNVVSSSSPAAFVDVYSNSLGSIPVVYRAARGSSTGPSQVMAGDIIGGLAGRGYFNYSANPTTGAFSSGGRAGVIFKANTAWTDLDQSTYINFNTTPSGSTTQAVQMVLTNAGSLGIGTQTPSANLEVNGNIKLTAGSGGQMIFADGSTQSTAATGEVTSITAASGSGLTVATGTSTPVIGTDPTVLQMRINAACGPGAYMTSVNSAGGITCSGAVSNPGTVTNVSAVSGSGLTVANATSTPQINTDFTVLQKRVAAACPSGQFLQSIGVDGTPNCQPLSLAVPSGFTMLSASPAPPAGFTVASWVAVNGRSPWSQTASLITARYTHGVATIGNNIYVVGGSPSAGSYLSSMERCNVSVANPTWSTVAPGSGSLTARGSVAVAVSSKAVSTGAIYVFGGNTGSASPLADMYDPVANTWTSKASLPQALIGACAAPDTAGNIYVLGGFYGSSTLSNAVYKYDPATNIYALMSPMPTGVYDPGCVTYNNRIYVFDGAAGSGDVNLTQIYDVASNSWTTGSQTPLASEGVAAAVLGSQIYVVGGRNMNTPHFLPTLIIYDPASDTWISAPNSPSAHAYTGAAAVVNNLLYAVGGDSGSGGGAEVDVYDPTAVMFLYTKN